MKTEKHNQKWKPSFNQHLGYNKLLRNMATAIDIKIMCN